MDHQRLDGLARLPAQPKGFVMRDLNAESSEYEPNTHAATELENDLVLNGYPKQHGDFTPCISALDLVAHMGHDGVQCSSSRTTHWKEFLHHE
jgi:hypothetical protein